MSSMRNAVQRRNHRERGQPEERKKWGLLEKHKDYSARARDFNAKKKTLKNLRAKVLEKNPDEFYYGMLSRKGPTTTGKNRTGTINGDRGNEVLNQEAVRLFKTQDLGYVRTMRNKAIKDVKALEMRVKGIQGDGKKVVWVDDVAEQGRRVGDGDEEMVDGDGFEDEDEDEEESESDDEPKLSVEEKNRRRLQQRETQRLENKLEVAKERLKALTQAEEALDLQRAKMSKSPTVGGVNKNGVKFKVRDRKR